MVKMCIIYIFERCRDTMQRQCKLIDKLSDHHYQNYYHYQNQANNSACKPNTAYKPRQMHSKPCQLYPNTKPIQNIYIDSSLADLIGCKWFWFSCGCNLTLALNAFALVLSSFALALGTFDLVLGDFEE